MTIKQHTNHYLSHLGQATDIAPLITFRILFGALMMIGALRFMAKGWVEQLYVEPQFFFKFYGFEWVAPLGEAGMYTLYSVIALSACCVMLGLFYRSAILIFFLSFTYSELVDATNYLNHYYLVSLQAFLLIFLPANRAFSLDVLRKKTVFATDSVPKWTVYSLMFLLGIVYTFAGLAKLNPDWLLRAMPLAIWLPEHTNLPLIGGLLQHIETAYAFSWAGAFYDLFIVFFLLNNRTRPFAYFAVLAFHLLTLAMFNIGLFPYIMIISTLIFFPAETHRKWLNTIFHPNIIQFLRDKLLLVKSPKSSTTSQDLQAVFKTSTIAKVVLPVFFLLQLALPIRHLLYPGDLMWTEEGYRFSWRVMLVEKTGQATFYIKDPKTGRQAEVDNSDFLTEFQEKQMAVQPDFMLQYAHFLQQQFQAKYNIEKPIVNVNSYVALNGRMSRQLIDPTIDLASIEDGFSPKTWVRSW